MGPSTAAAAFGARRYAPQIGQVMAYTSAKKSSTSAAAENFSPRVSSTLIRLPHQYCVDTEMPMIRGCRIAAAYGSEKPLKASDRSEVMPRELPTFFAYSSMVHASCLRPARKLKIS